MHFSIKSCCFFAAKVSALSRQSPQRELSSDLQVPSVCIVHTRAAAGGGDDGGGGGGGGAASGDTERVDGAVNGGIGGALQTVAQHSCIVGAGSGDCIGEGEGGAGGGGGAGGINRHIGGVLLYTPK
jgi:hypothetical protein